MEWRSAHGSRKTPTVRTTSSSQQRAPRSLVQSIRPNQMCWGTPRFRDCGPAGPLRLLYHLPPPRPDLRLDGVVDHAMVRSQQSTIIRTAIRIIYHRQDSPSVLVPHRPVSRFALSPTPTLGLRQDHTEEDAHGVRVNQNLWFGCQGMPLRRKMTKIPKRSTDNGTRLNGRIDDRVGGKDCSETVDRGIFTSLVQTNNMDKATRQMCCIPITSLHCTKSCSLLYTSTNRCGLDPPYIWSSEEQTSKDCEVREEQNARAEICRWRSRPGILCQSPKRYAGMSE